MKTLRDEWRRMTDAMWQHLYTNQFFRKYGDYRVVEGVLTSVALKDSPCGQTRVWTCIHTDDGTRIDIAPQGDRVKLILPPEEKDKTPRIELLARVCELENDVRETELNYESAAARADRYEKALREIAERDEEAMPLSTEYQLTKMLCAVATLAREALDDSA